MRLCPAGGRGQSVSIDKPASLDKLNTGNTGNPMVDWNKTFKAEYDFAQAFLANPGNFAKDWQSLVKDLQSELCPGQA